MTVFGYAALFGLALCLVAVAGVHGYRSGYKYGLKEGDQKGYQRGLDEGRKKEASFWIGTEQQVDRERQRMWEQGSKPEGRWL